MGIQRVLFRFITDSGFIAGAVRVAFMSVMMILAAEARAHDERTVSGTVFGSDGEGSINFATIYFKDTHYGTQTADDGRWTLTAPEGDYVLVISAVGYGTVERPVRLASTRPGGPGRYPLGNKTGHGRGRGDRSGSAFDGLRGSDGGHDSGPDGRRDSGRGSGEGAGRRDSCRMSICHGDYIEVTLDPENEALDEAVVTAAGGVGRVKRSAFNAVAVDVKGLGNSTQNLSDALTRLPGMKLRESGGVGSDMQLMLDGFSGRHVKAVNFAERIEVYKGVVPVGFGTDALGGVVHIVTNRNRNFNIEEKSGGYAMFRCWHVTGDWFLLQMYTGGTSEQDAIGGIGGGTNALAVFRGSTGEFRYVTQGLPEQDSITSVGSTPYCENGSIYVSLVTNDGASPAVYRIDPETAAAVKGISVKCDAINAVGKLYPVQ